MRKIVVGAFSRNTFLRLAKYLGAITCALWLTFWLAVILHLLNQFLKYWHDQFGSANIFSCQI